MGGCGNIRLIQSPWEKEFLNRFRRRRKKVLKKAFSNLSHLIKSIPPIIKVHIYREIKKFKFTKEELLYFWMLIATSKNPIDNFPFERKKKFTEFQNINRTALNKSIISPFSFVCPRCTGTGSIMTVFRKPTWLMKSYWHSKNFPVIEV